MTTIAEIRRANARHLAGDNHSQFGRQLSMKRTQVSHLIGVNPIKGIGDRIARRIEATYGKPSGWLDVAHPEICAGDEERSHRDIPALDPAIESGNSDALPVMNAWEWVRIPLAWLRTHVSPPWDQLGITTYNNDDMQGELDRGSLLLVDRSGSRVDTAGLYLLLDGNETVVRRCNRSHDGVHMMCANRVYQHRDRIVADAESHRVPVLGRVLYSWGPRGH